MQPARTTPIAQVALLALFFGAAGGGIAGYMVARSRPPAPAAGAATPSPAPVTGRIRVLTDKDAIVQAVKRASPAVVKIETLRAPTMSELFDQFFSGLMQPQPIRGVGSGFIFDYNGRKFVLTNTHVVGDAERMRVKLVDGRAFDAVLLGADSHSDVAVVEMPDAPPNLPTATLGDSDRLQVGEWVIAVGNPFDYEHTVTVGVVSAKGYRPVGEGKKRRVIQTDAAINIGNSGGPLLDLAGNVVGINYKIFTTTGATVGIGFAIPINDAKARVKLLVEGGPWVGLPGNGLMVNSPGLAAHLGLATDKGVVVFYVEPGSPAARAGIKPGDVILAVDGKTVRDPQQVDDAILAHRIGDTIRFQIQRGRQVLDVSVVAGRIRSP